MLQLFQHSLSLFFKNFRPALLVTKTCVINLKSQHLQYKSTTRNPSQTLGFWKILFGGILGGNVISFCLPPYYPPPPKFFSFFLSYVELKEQNLERRALFIKMSLPHFCTKGKTVNLDQKAIILKKSQVRFNSIIFSRTRIIEVFRNLK